MLVLFVHCDELPLLAIHLVPSLRSRLAGTEGHIIIIIIIYYYYYYYHYYYYYYYYNYIIMTSLTRVKPVSKAVINGCPGSLDIHRLKDN